MKKFWGAVVLMMLAVAHANAADVKVDDAWSRATAPGQDSAMVQMVITSKKAAKLVGASCKDAASVEMHSMVHENGMMMMRQVEAIELAAGKPLDFEATGYHLMLIGLKHPLKAGGKTEVTLLLRLDSGKEEKVVVKAKIKPLDEPAQHERMNMKMDMQH